jgi:hypothetical protein
MFPASLEVVAVLRVKDGPAVRGLFPVCVWLKLLALGLVAHLGFPKPCIVRGFTPGSQYTRGTEDRELPWARIVLALETQVQPECFLGWPHEGGQKHESSMHSISGGCIWMPNHPLRSLEIEDYGVHLTLLE